VYMCVSVCIVVLLLQRFNPESLEFLGKMLERSGINPHNTYTPPWLVNEPICMVSPSAWWKHSSSPLG